MFLSYLTFPSWIKPEIIPGVNVGTWYGLMYLFAFLTSWTLAMSQIKKVQKDPAFEHKREIFNKENLSNLFTWSIIGLLLGARLFSVLVYADNRLHYWTHPWLIFWPFEGGRFVGLRGMSYHGGIIGCSLVALIFCKVKKFKFLEWADFVSPTIPLGYTFGRLGNFINQELYGRVTTSAVGMLFDPPGMEKFSSARFPKAAEIATELGLSPYGLINLPRHPSQLYEAFFEGIVLWAILWFVVRRFKKQDGQVFGSYVFGYGFFRFFIEYFREPDANLGYLINFTGKEFSRWDLAWRHPLGAISMGQILCFIMMLVGLMLILVPSLFNRRKERLETEALKEKKATKAK